MTRLALLSQLSQQWRVGEDLHIKETLFYDYESHYLSVISFLYVVVIQSNHVTFGSILEKDLFEMLIFVGNHSDKY